MMLIGDIIRQTAVLLNLSAFEEPQLKAADEMTLDEDDKRKLLQCVDFTVDEVARDYFPLMTTESVSARDGKIRYADFSREPIAVSSVRAGGKPAEFFRLHDGLKVERDGVYEVRYAFKPRKAALDGETEWEDETVSARILTYGAAAEYCIICGLEADAQMWDKRYRDALERAAATRASGRKIPRRRWTE